MAQQINISERKLNEIVSLTFKGLIKAIVQSENDDGDGKYDETDILSQLNADQISFNESNRIIRSSLGKTNIYINHTINDNNIYIELIQDELDWSHITAATMHELDQTISWKLSKMVKKMKNPKISLSKEMQKELNKKMSKQEINYIDQLIQRAIINTQNISTSKSFKRLKTEKKEENALNDIFNVYIMYKFSNCHFEQFKKAEFIKLIKNNKFLNENKIEIANKFDAEYEKYIQFNLYPSWIIEDDQFSIFNYFFCTSYIINKLQSNPGYKKYQFSIYIVPQKIVSIYDENMVFGVDIGDIATFLDKNGFNQFVRANIKETDVNDPLKLFETINYCLNCPGYDFLSNDVLLIIDRRQKQNILYILNASIYDDKLVKLRQNHLLGMEFNIIDDTVRCYLRLFKRDNNKLSDYEYINKVYDSRYKHGFGVNLNDKNFNKMYKLILNSSHISVNYNRDYVEIEKDDIKEEEYEYVLPVMDQPNIEWMKSCNLENVKEITDCLYIKYIIEILKTWEIAKYNVNTSNCSTFNELLLTATLDHLISVHAFCLNPQKRKETKQYIQDKNGECKQGIKCLVLHNFSNRSREKIKKHAHTNENANKSEQKQDDKEEAGNIKINIISDVLTSLHCYLQHSKWEMYRNNAGSGNNKFSTTVQTSIKSLQFIDEFDLFINKILNLEDKINENKNKMNESMVFLTNMMRYWQYDEYDFDAVCDDIIYDDRNQSNLYYFLSSIKKESYFDIIYAQILNIHLNEMEQKQSLNELDALHAFIMNNDKISDSVFIEFRHWINKNKYDWNKIIADIECGVNKSNISIYFGQHFFMVIDKFIANTKMDDIIAINFGVSIHEWLQYNEAPLFKTFRDEVLNNLTESIDIPLYNKYKSECRILQNVLYKYKFTVKELMTIKLYTDTTDLCRAFRMSFWKNKKNKNIKKQFYWWGLSLFKTMLYHQHPLNKRISTQTEPMTIYHGLSKVFISENICPFYNGPISTTSEMSVGEQFCDSSGLLWSISSSYSNPFKFVCGLKVQRISCFPEESEVLLYNSYLPISKTRNFEEDEETQINLFLSQIKIYKQKEINAANFYKQIGFKYKKDWIHSIKQNPLLYEPLDIDKNEMVIHRLVDSFNITEFDISYNILTTKFMENDQFKHFGTLYTMNLNDDKYIESFKDCKYKLVSNDGTTQILKYNEPVQIKSDSTYKATIFVSNESIFERKTEFELQQISGNYAAETAAFYLYYDEINKCITFNKSNISLQNVDIAESIRNAKYQIKYVNNNNPNDVKYGKEYICSKMGKFGIPIDPVPANRYFFNLFVAPFHKKVNSNNAKERLLEYESYFDDKGTLYGLATNFGNNVYSNPAKLGKVKVISSKYIGENNNCLVGRKGIDFTLKGNNKNPPFFYVNLGEYALKINGYTLRNSVKQNGILRYWSLLGSHDGIKWIVLKKHINDDTLKKKGKFEPAVWKIDNDKNIKYYSYFKVLMNGINHTGDWQFGCSGLELYGHLIDGFKYIYHQITFYKTYCSSKFHNNSTNPLQIDSDLMVNKYDAKTRSGGGYIDIYCSSSIIIQKDGAINANQCIIGGSLKFFKYESDFDKNGILYGIATNFGSQKYKNPAISRLVTVVSSKMVKGKCSSFVGRDKVTVKTVERTGSFFYVNLKRNKVRLTAYSLSSTEGAYIRNWDLEGSNDGQSWQCLKKHRNDKSMSKGRFTSKTWMLNNVNTFYSFFKIKLTEKDGVCCSRIELYGDLLSHEENESKQMSYSSGGGQITLYSDSSIINYGNITSNGSNDQCFAGSINIKCKTFKNFGKIESKNNGIIRIQCGFFENKSVISPKPTVNIPWKYLLLNDENDFIKFDYEQIPERERKDFMTVALNAKYEIKYLDYDQNEIVVDEYKLDGDKIKIPIKQNNPYYSSIKLIISSPKNNVKTSKIFILSKFVIKESNNPLEIDSALMVNKYDTKTGLGGNIKIKCCSSIIIQKNGAINANQCVTDGSLKSLRFKYESDFDENGILHAIGTNFGSQKYKNPALSGLVNVVSSEIWYGDWYAFVGREKDETSTTEQMESFFCVNLKTYKVRPRAYSLRNSGDDYSRYWQLEGSNDGISWQCLKKHENDESLKGHYTTKTWLLDDINSSYSFFKIKTTKSEHLYCSGMELYGDLICYEENESKQDSLHISGGGQITLYSDSSIINYGNITSNGSNNQCFGGPIFIKCKIFKNFGKIESKNNGIIRIQCDFFENTSTIYPKPTVNMPWDYLFLNDENDFIQFDYEEMSEREREDFIRTALNTKYEIKYLDYDHNEITVDEYKLDGDKIKIPINNNNPYYSSIKLIIFSPQNNIKMFKSFILSKFVIKESIPLQIDSQVMVNKFDAKTRSGAHIKIYCSSSIIIQKDGAINANQCGTPFVFESDFDENGVLYAIGTCFGSKEYKNPALSGLVTISSYKMDEGASYSFIGRDKVNPCTKSHDAAFFCVDLKTYKLRPTAYSLRNIDDDGEFYCIKNWQLEGSNDGISWQCLKKHKNDDSLKGKCKSQTWSLKDVNKFYSLFKIKQTETKRLYCSGMELYGDLICFEENESKQDISISDNLYNSGGGQITLISDSSITNYGNITSNGSNDECFGGPICIKCKTFKNFGKIESKNNGIIRIQCDFFENKSIIYPKPTVNISWDYLLLNDENDFIEFDYEQIPERERKDFMTVALNAKYEIKYLDYDQNEAVDEYKMDGDKIKIPINNNNPYYSSIKLIISSPENNIKTSKIFILSKFAIKESNNPLEIDSALMVNKYDTKTGLGGNIEIKCCSSIIIQKDGAINANQCIIGRPSFKYKSDFDENGILYAIGTNLGSQKYKNPALSGLVDVVSSKMAEGESFAFIGRDKVDAHTQEQIESFFYVNLKAFKVRPNAYTLRNSYGLECHFLENWELEGSNDGISWQCLKKHENDKLANDDYESKTWSLPDVNTFYSFFKIKTTGSAVSVYCSGMELYGDLIFYEENESKQVSDISGGGQITLISDSSITNYGNITSNGSNDQCFGGSINIKCKTFKNFGKIESKNNGIIRIQCDSFENKSIIYPKPIL